MRLQRNAATAGELVSYSSVLKALSNSLISGHIYHKTVMDEINDSLWRYVISQLNPIKPFSKSYCSYFLPVKFLAYGDMNVSRY